jgi:predicted Zn-dependent protease
MQQTMWLAGLLSALLAACATTTNSGSVGVDRPQLLLVASEQVNADAAVHYLQRTSAARSRGQLNPDPAQTERVRGIAHRLIQHATAFRPTFAGWNWEVNIVDSPQVNANCAPGGKIVVYTGLLTRLAPTDDELAGLIGHEIAHALREHTREQISQRVLADSAVRAAVQSTTRDPKLVGQVARFSADLIFLLPFSRQMESEADAIGLELAARAGFDPRKAANFWRKMQAAGGASQPEFFTTHPSHERRVAETERLAEVVLPLYAAAPPPLGQSSAGVSTTRIASNAIAISNGPSDLPGVLKVTETSVPRPAPLPVGRDSFQAEQFARRNGCATSENSVLVAKGPGYEVFTLRCDAGQVIRIRCDFGTCVREY